MKVFFIAFLLYFTLFCTAQTWQSAYDSCKKYQDLQQYKKAIEWGDKALELYEKQVLMKDTNYSNILNRQIENCYYSGLYKKGELYAKKDSIWSKSYIQDLSRYSISCNNLALLYEVQGHYTEAEALFKETKSILEKTLGKEHIQYATTCNNLAVLYKEQGRFTEAEVLFKEIKNTLQKVLSKEHVEYATACNNLANMYISQDRYNEAEPLYKEARAILEKVLNKKHPDYASSCNNLATLYHSQRRYSEAEPLYKEARAILEKVLGKEHPSYAASCNNLANLYKAQGRYSEAELLYKEAKAIYEKILGKKHPDYANLCNNLAILYKSQRLYSEAEILYKESKTIYEKILGTEHPNYATCCNNLAELYKEQGRYSKAESLFKEAKAIREKMLGKESPNYAASCNNLAELYKEQGRYDEAEALCKESKTIYEKILGRDHPSYALSCRNLARLYHKQGLYYSAEPLYIESIQVKQKEIEKNFKGLSEAEKEKYIKANIEGFFTDFQCFVSKRYLENPFVAGYAYNLAIFTKGLILESTQKIKNRILNSKDENLKNLYLEWKQTKDKYAKFQNLTIQQRLQKKINLDSIEKRANELEKELASKSEDFAHVFISKSVTWQDIQSKLEQDQAAIEVIRVELNTDDYFYMIFFLKKESNCPKMIVLQSDSLEKEYLINYRRSTRHKLYDPYSYNVFWKKIKEKLKDIKTVYFSPDGIYHQINLLTLQNPETKKYVFDEIQIINVTNTKDILQKPKKHSKNSHLIGNPTFNLGIDTKGNEKPEEFHSISNLSQLPGAENEVKQVANYLPNSKLITGKEATEEYVKYLKNPRILHVATHGYFKKGQYQSSTQAMLNGGLLFAGVVDYDRMEIRPFDKEDGKLTAFEVMNMELDSTELVVLSACETGLGKASKEGVYGLQRAFKVAGAECIIMSLWKVNDEATQLLMTKFYENWQKKGMSKRVAFETAQKEIRKQYKEPYYWGAFVMIE